MELSCTRQGNSVHLLAYGADPAAPGLAEEMAKVRGGRMGRLAGVLRRLAELGVPVTEEQVLAEVGNSPSVGRPHIADAMVKAGHVRDRTEAFDRFLADGGPAHVARYAIDVERGIDLVHQAGGVAVIAHPWGRGREATLPRGIPVCADRRARAGRHRGRSSRPRCRDPGATAAAGRRARSARDRLERLPRHWQDQPRPRQQHHRSRRVRRPSGAARALTSKGGRPPLNPPRRADNTRARGKNSKGGRPPLNPPRRANNTWACGQNSKGDDPRAANRVRSLLRAGS